jgi:uncharacterized protein YndB with AHSA1/START domain
MPEELYSLAMDAADGQLEEHDGRWRLRFERRLAHPPERVWRAITEPDDLRAWFPFDIEGDRAAGAPLRFVFRDGEAEPFEGRMVDFDAPRALELEWGGGERLRLEVRPDGAGSVLTLLNTFDEHGKAARDGAGWHACLDALAERLDGAAAPDAPEDRWARLHDAYRARFGPAASTIGPPS